MRRAPLCFIALLFAASGTLAAQALPGRRATYVVVRVAEHNALLLTARNTGASEPPHVGLWGFISGALIGGGAGHYAGLGLCDGVPRGNCVRNSTIGGIIIGAGVGYGLERLFRWR